MADPSPLPGEQRNAFDAITYFFEKQAGFTGPELNELRNFVQTSLIEGHSEDTITLRLNETAAYKKRFKANDIRREKGLSVLSPKEIIDMEDQYKGLMRQYGLPSNMFDSYEDMTTYIGNDISVNEMNDRLNVARMTVTADDPFVRDTYRQWYASGLTEGDAIAAVLDPDRALPELERKARTAKLGGGAAGAGWGMDQARAEQLAGLGVDAGIREFGEVRDMDRQVDRLSGFYGGNISDRDVEDAAFLNDSDARESIRKLGSRERAEFGGRGGNADSRSLGQARY